MLLMRQTINTNKAMTTIEVIIINEDNVLPSASGVINNTKE